jgi:activating signal cointegrator 1
VALGAKSIETRSWRTWYRGCLLVHAARAFPRWARDLCKQEPFASALVQAGYTNPRSGLADPGQLPLGMILAICNLKHCVRIGTPGIELPPSEPERSFGDYTLGRYAWVLSDVQPLPEPIAAHGSIGLWEPDQAVQAALELLHAGM